MARTLSPSARAQDRAGRVSGEVHNAFADLSRRVSANEVSIRGRATADDLQTLAIELRQRLEGETALREAAREDAINEAAKQRAEEIQRLEQILQDLQIESLRDEVALLQARQSERVIRASLHAVPTVFDAEAAYWRFSFSSGDTWSNMRTLNVVPEIGPAGVAANEVDSARGWIQMFFRATDRLRMVVHMGRVGTSRLTEASAHEYSRPIFRVDPNGGWDFRGLNGTVLGRIAGEDASFFISLYSFPNDVELEQEAQSVFINGQITLNFARSGALAVGDLVPLSITLYREDLDIGLHQVFTDDPIDQALLGATARIERRVLPGA